MNYIVEFLFLETTHVSVYSECKFFGGKHLKLLQCVFFQFKFASMIKPKKFNYLTRSIFILPTFNVRTSISLSIFCKIINFDLVMFNDNLLI